MNFINPQLIMQNALRNKQFRKVDDIYPPSESDFDNSLNYYNKLNEEREKTSDMNQHVKVQQELKQEKPKYLETFYIPEQPQQMSNYENKQCETFDFPNVFKPHFNPNTNTNAINNPIKIENPTIIVIIILILIIIYLYVKIENLKTKLECYSKYKLIDPKIEI